MTEIKGIDHWTDKQVEVAGDLGMDEIIRRVDALNSYYKFDTAATIYDSRPLTPEQAIAWAKFAQSLGKDWVLNGSSIQKPKPWDELALKVVNDELAGRAKQGYQYGGKANGQ